MSTFLKLKPRMVPSNNIPKLKPREAGLSFGTNSLKVRSDNRINDNNNKQININNTVASNNN